MTSVLSLRSAALVAAALLCLATGCSLKNKPNFDGTFNGKSTVGLTMRMPDGTTDKESDPKPDDDTYVIRDEDGPEIQVQVLDEEDHCTVKAVRDGAKATVTPGQTCVSKNGSDSMSLKVSSGTVSLSGDEVTIDITFATSITADKTTVPGTLALHFTGKR
jgi:hypothetical protein